MKISFRENKARQVWREQVRGEDARLSIRDALTLAWTIPQDRPEPPVGDLILPFPPHAGTVAA